MARFASSTLTYDEKSCIGTSSLERELDGAGGQGAFLDARQRVQVAALARRICLRFRARPQILEARRVGAAGGRDDDDVEQVRVDVAGACRRRAGASRLPRRRSGRARVTTSARSRTARRKRTSSSSFAAGDQPSFAARSP